jgi:hypothetical protein
MARLLLFERYVGAQQNNSTAARVLNFKLPRFFPAPSHLGFFVAELYLAITTDLA